MLDESQSVLRTFFVWNPAIIIQGSPAAFPKLTTKPHINFRLSVARRRVIHGSNLGFAGPFGQRTGILLISTVTDSD